MQLCRCISFIFVSKLCHPFSSEQKWYHDVLFGCQSILGLRFLASHECMFIVQLSWWNVHLQMFSPRPEADGEPAVIVSHTLAIKQWRLVFSVYFSWTIRNVFFHSLHQRKSARVQLHRPQLHYEEEDGALERGNGADWTLAPGQRPPPTCFLYKAMSHSNAKACQILLLSQCLYLSVNQRRQNQVSREHVLSGVFSFRNSNVSPPLHMLSRSSWVIFYITLADTSYFV